MKKTKIQNRSTKNDEVIAALPLACHDEKAAVEFMEQQRWGAHSCCPHCGDMNVYQMMDSKDPTKRQANYRWRCRGCKAQYSVRTGTVYEESRIPLKHWCFAFWRASTSKKGVSALEIHRQTGLSYKSSLFLLHRIRYAMADTPAIMGGLGKIVEADETYFGTEEGKDKRERSRRGGAAHNAMNKIVALVERNGGVRSMHVADVTSNNLKAMLVANIAKDTHVMTDSSPRYNLLKRESPFAKYDQVNHSKGEYVRGIASTNTVESYFSILKRGLNGIYHNVSSHHLHRYLSEFDFRYCNRHLDDGERTTLAIRKANGKRLMYKEPVKKAN
jgi:transposase-like protein